MTDQTPAVPDDADPGLTGADLPPIDPALAAWLASDPAPPMPAQVWDRLEAALAAEPPFVASTPTAADAAVASAPVADLAAARTRRSGRLWPVLAGAAGVALVGLVALPALRGGDAPPVADGPLTAEAAIEIPTPASVTAPQGNEPQVADAPATSSSEQVATAPAPAESSAPEGAGPTPATTATASPAIAMPVAMLDTGTTYSPEAIPAQVTTLLTTAGMADSQSMARALGGAEATPNPSPMSGVGMLASPEALHNCLLRLGIPESAKPLIVDHGSFEGLDAGLVVTVGSMRSDGTPGDLHVVVVGTQCADADVAAARHFDLPVAP